MYVYPLPKAPPHPIQTHLKLPKPQHTNKHQYEKNLGARPILVGNTDELTEQFNGLGALVASQSPPPDPSVKTRDDTADGVPVRVYTPEAASSSKKLPLGVYAHGGGYVLGSLDSEDAWCRYVAKNVPCVVVSVDYRLAPKAKMPAMLDDCVKGFQWVSAAS